jgi:hypothetical protein
MRNNQSNPGTPHHPQHHTVPQDPVPPEIYLVLNEQSHNGSFALTQTLTSLLTTNNDPFQLQAPDHVPSDVWATVLVIAYFQKHLTRHPDLLEGLLEKAMEFITSVAVSTESLSSDFDFLLQRARQIVDSL